MSLGLTIPRRYVHIGQRPGAAGWTPSALTGLYTWHDLDTAVQTDANGIYQWDDLSGNGYHLLQTVDGEKPDLVTLDGLLAAQEDEVDDHFSYSSTHTFSGEITFAALLHNSKVGGFLANSGSPSTGIQSTTALQSKVFTTAGNKLIANAIGVWKTNQWYVIVIRRDSSDDWSHRTNGVDHSLGLTNRGGDFILEDIPRDISTSLYECNEIVTANSFVTGSDLTNLERYLMSQAGL